MTLVLIYTLLFLFGINGLVLVGIINRQQRLREQHLALRQTLMAIWRITNRQRGYNNGRNRNQK